MSGGAPVQEPTVAEAPPRASEFFWDDVGPSPILAHLTRPVVVQLDRFGARTVLDLGCGNGWFTDALTRCGFEATGADVSHSGIALARESYRGVAFERADVLKPLPPAMRGSFDAVVAIELLDHVAQPRLALRHAMTALRPGGLLVTTVPYHGYLKNLGLALLGRMDARWQALRDHGRVKFFSRGSLLALARESGLHDIHFETIGRVPPLARSMLVAGKVPAVR